MRNHALRLYLNRYLTKIEGSNGSWSGERDGVLIFVFSDEQSDRLRLLSAIGTFRSVSVNDLLPFLRANLDRALDAKYAMRDNELWAVAMHPMTTLDARDLEYYLDQVVQLAKNYATTRASTDAIFTLAKPEREITDGPALKNEELIEIRHRIDRLVSDDQF